jgi:predicted nucleotidyltransferase
MIDIAEEALAAFCRRECVRRLSVFGSVLRDDFRTDSDVDMLIDFQPGRRIGYIELAGLEAELSELVGRQVDLRTAQDLSPYFRDEVLASARLVYDAGD